MKNLVKLTIPWNWEVRAEKALPFLHRLLNAAASHKNSIVTYSATEKLSGNGYCLSFVIGTTELDARVLYTSRKKSLRITIELPESAVGAYMRKRRLVETVFESDFSRLFEYEYAVVDGLMRAAVKPEGMAWTGYCAIKLPEAFREGSRPIHR